MIATVLWISLQRLWNSKHELLLVFVVPICFFSIFALIFSRGVGQTGKPIRVSVVRDDQSPQTDAIIEGLLEQERLRQVTGIGHTEPEWPIERLARVLIANYQAEVVVYFPDNYATSLDSIVPVPVQVLSEGTSPIGEQVVQAALTRAIAIHRHRKQVPTAPLGMPNIQLAAAVSASSPEDNRGAALAINTEHVFASNKHQPKIAMYAAGIAVMFLLFSSSGAGASLLEEKEAGTLTRLLSSRLTMTELILGKWLYITLLGLVQITTMFLWGQFVFHVDLFGHLPGFGVMALATTSASASFALFLASVCRTRNQLNGVALVVVLGMSALGGSMIPRYIMSDSMQQLGRLTFNGWALDGFKKIFWYDAPLSAIRLEVMVLVSITLVFGFIGNMLVRRWNIA